MFKKEPDHKGLSRLIVKLGMLSDLAVVNEDGEGGGSFILDSDRRVFFNGAYIHLGYSYNCNDVGDNLNMTIKLTNENLPELVSMLKILKLYLVVK